MDLEASRLAEQHSMHLVDSGSCCSPCADNMAALGAAKGASMDDDDGMVATWWRPSEPCTSRSFAAACSAGGSGGMARLEAAWGTLELRVERRSKVAMGPSACGCMRMVAELLLGHQSPWMLPRSIPGVLFHSGGLVGPPWVPKGVHSRVWVIGPHTHRGGGGVLHVHGRGRAVPHHQKLFSCGFLWHTLLNRCRPDLGTLKTKCHRLIKRWDENTLLNK